MSNEAEFRKIKKEFNELDIIRQNIEKALDIKVSSEESINTRENKKKHNEIVQWWVKDYWYNFGVSSLSFFDIFEENEFLGGWGFLQQAVSVYTFALLAILWKWGFSRI